MAHLLFIAETAMKNFIAMWISGLQPTLDLLTMFDGSIFATLNVSSAQKPSLDKARRRRKSGTGARQRRKLIRDSNSSEMLQSQDLKDSKPRPTKPRKVDIAIQVSIGHTDVACETEPPDVHKKTFTAEKVSTIDIPPRKIYNPAIINASKAFYQKHPSELTKEEKVKFKFYLQHKRSCGEPVETDIIYLPSSMRNCLHCGHPT